MADSKAKLPQLFTLDEVARAMALSPHTIRAFVRTGKLHPLRICRRLLFHPDELARFIDAADRHKGRVIDEVHASTEEESAQLSARR